MPHTAADSNRPTRAQSGASWPECRLRSDRARSCRLNKHRRHRRRLWAGRECNYLRAVIVVSSVPGRSDADIAARGPFKVGRIRNLVGASREFGIAREIGHGCPRDIPNSRTVTMPCALVGAAAWASGVRTPRAAKAMMHRHWPVLRRVLLFHNILERLNSRRKSAWPQISHRGKRPTSRASAVEPPPRNTRHDCLAAEGSVFDGDIRSGRRMHKAK